MPDTPHAPNARIKMLYDWLCPLCKREVRAIAKHDKHGRIEPVDITAPGFDAEHFGLTRAAVHARMHAVLPDGSAVARDRSFVATGLTIPGRGACFHLSSGSYRSDADCEALAASARALLTSSRALLDYNLARVVAGVDSSRTPRVDD